MPAAIESVDNLPLLNCPHCGGAFLMISLDCGIFRHGIFKKNGQQIGQHLSKYECDLLKLDDLIWGCGKPFEVFSKGNGQFEVKICDYK